MTPNYFRFVATTLRDTTPTEGSPNYPTWDTFTANNANEPNWSATGTTGSLSANPAHGGDLRFYAAADNTDSKLDLREGRVVWEFTFDGASSNNYGVQDLTYELGAIGGTGQDFPVLSSNRPSNFSNNNWSTNQTTRLSIYYGTWKTWNYEWKEFMPAEVTYRMIYELNDSQTQVELTILTKVTGIDLPAGVSDYTFDQIDAGASLSGNNAHYYWKIQKDANLVSGDDDRFFVHPKWMIKNYSGRAGNEFALKHFKMWIE